MGKFRIPMIQVEEDGDIYWTAKYLNDMGLGWSLQSDTRVLDGYGVFRVVGTEAQLTTLGSYSDVTRIEE